MAFERRQQPQGTVHVTLRGPAPEPPAEGRGLGRAMARWKIAADEPTDHSGGDTRWRWELRRADGGGDCGVVVTVRATAMSSRDVPDVTEAARRSRGRSVVEAVLDWHVPPDEIVLSTATIEPVYVGGEQYPPDA